MKAVNRTCHGEGQSTGLVKVKGSQQDCHGEGIANRTCHGEGVSRQDLSG